MKLYTVVIVVLLVCAVLTTDTEAGWFKKTVKKLGKAVKKVAKSEAVKGVTDIVRRYVPAVAGRILGKRSADCPGETVANIQLARSLMDELDLACPRLFGTDLNRALTPSVLEQAFGQSDGDMDGKLNDKELDLFENVVDAVKHCLNILKQQQGK